MLPKFLEGLGTNLAQQWTTRVFSPSFIFWLGGALSWGWRFGWSDFEALLTQKTQALPLAQLILGLLIVAVSAIAVQRVELNVLRFLEGYWIGLMKPLQDWFVNRQFAQLETVKNTLREFSQRGLHTLEPQDLDKYVRLDWQRKQTPKQKERLMPTRLGNILRAAERRPLEKYGLESVVCFPRLWLLLPSEVKTELTEARAQLNAMVRVWIWSILFITWGVWAWWAIPIGMITAWFAYHWMLDAAVIYGDLLEATFDLHRPLLYKSLRWRLPKNPTEEQELGRALTDYLWRGFTEPEPTFEEPEKK
jgi:hypothetical protein